ncbi:MAG: YwiC-like family protein [Fidelibacterota bacterium]
MGTIAYRLGPFPVPRQHGAWAMFLIPTFMALAVARPWNWSSPVLAGAYVLVFLSHRPAGQVVRAWGSRRSVDPSSLVWTLILGGSGAGTVVILLAIHHVWIGFLLGILVGATFGLHLRMTLHRRHMSTRGEMMGVFGLTAAGPLTYVFVQGTLDPLGWFLWLINFLYFAGSVHYVKLKLRVQPSTTRPPVLGRFRPGLPSLVHSLVVLAVVSGITLVQGTSWLFVAAYGPFVLKVFTGVFRWQDKDSLHVTRFGFTELAHALVFGTLATGAFLSPFSQVF